ncbi:MAG: 30S ribosomal protein S2 [Planctomycetaceae bacterium]|nr:30S ribosomal protein S2 [Planctomycetaceae bacterium]
MASLVQELIEAGIHFGQRRSNWNPKMAPYIHGVRNQIHILDVRESIKGLLLAKRFIEQTVGRGKDVCFVGTKRQARGAIEQYAADVGMPFVTERWLGGTLTNFRTIRERLKRLEELDRIVESGELKNYSKKMESQLLRERKKIQRNLGGVRQMTQMPGALIVVDTNREKNALLEAKSLGIPTVCLVDTDGDPDMVDIPIPGNDDSMRTIDIIVRELCDAVKKGKEGRSTSGGDASGEKSGGRADTRGEGPSDGGAPRRRSSRSRYSASASAPAGGESAE